MTLQTNTIVEPLAGDIVECLEYRCATLDFLSRMHQGELEPAVVASVLHEIAQWPPASADASQGQELLRSFAGRTLAVDPVILAADLSAEYVAMFFSSWRRVVAPYESVYTSRDHVMMQEPVAQLTQMYAQEGLVVEATLTEPSDHIALELAFLAYLCQRALSAAGRGEWNAVAASVKKQQRFLKEHLLTWGPDFCRDLAATTQSDFYRGVAWLTAEFLESDLQTLDELLQLLPARAGEGSQVA
jgi:putative dimethyl sulfoxide reductase chaperone